MKTSIISLRLFLCWLLVLSSAAGAVQNLSVVAEIGAPAADFPSEFVYYNVSNPVIGRNGHVAFLGAADVSISSTAENTNAVWTGQPGDLRTVLKENESPAGFSASTVMDFAYPESLIVSDAGSVLFQAQMKGSSPGRALVADVDGTAFGIMQVGASAPGLGAGVNVIGVTDFVFSDAGAVIEGLLSNGQSALWFWDTNTMSLLLRTGDRLAPLYADCSVLVANVVGINNDGEILFTAGLEPAVNGAACPAMGLYTWRDGTLRKVVAWGDPVPGMSPNREFRNLTPLIPLNSINDNGDVTFGASAVDAGNDHQNGIWFAEKGSGIRPIAFDGESVPGFPNELMAIPVFTDSVSNAGGTAMFSTVTTGGATVILFGEAKTGPNFSANGESHLSLLLHSKNPPPGFGSTWFLDAVGWPLLNNLGQIAFWGIAKDATQAFPAGTQGIWLGDSASSLALIAAQGEPAIIDGVEQVLTRVGNVATSSRDQTESTNAGRAVQLSDTGQLVFMGARDGHPSGTFLSAILVTVNDIDGDSVVDQIDNCPSTPNPDQEDFDQDGTGDACDLDDDNDGMPDEFERAKGFDPQNASDANGDADGDGDTNLAEYLAGTDPLDPNSSSKPPRNPVAILIQLLLNR